MTETNIKNIEKRLFIKIKFDNEKIGYGELTIPQKFTFIANIIDDNIHLISKNIKVDFVDYEKSSPFKNIIYFTAYTIQNRNHPIIGYISKGNTANELILIRPIGRKKYNLNIDQLEVYLHRSKLYYLYDIYALYLSIIKSIVIRKEELITNPEFSLLSCHNIKGCITATKKAMETNNKTKKTVIQNYRTKAIKVITNYFNALESNDITSAEKILGTDKDNKISEINNTFRSTKKLRGHLEIFITLYKLVNIVKDKYHKVYSDYKKYAEKKGAESKK